MAQATEYHRNYLSRGVVGGEFLEDVFPAGEAAVLTVRISAAMLAQAA